MKYQIFSLVFLLAGGSALASKEIFYTDQNITIYTDNTVVETRSGKSAVFKPSDTWVEEDYFTQQEKYCEVDSIYGDRLKQMLKSFTKE